MSNALRISYVVEGVTDYIVLDALVEQILGHSDYVPTRIQPPESEYVNHLGALGGGWKGVLHWCSLGVYATALNNCDYLIVHVDADIAEESELSELNLSAPCPPASTTSGKIRDYLVALLGGAVPPKIILCVPAQCIEAWVFVALYPSEVERFTPIDCRREVESLFIGKPEKLVVKKDGRARKQTAEYSKVSPRIGANLAMLTAHCAEALRFESEVRRVFSLSI